MAVTAAVAAVGVVQHVSPASPRSEVTFQTKLNGSNIWGRRLQLTMASSWRASEARQMVKALLKNSDDNPHQITGKCFVLDDNIDTDQIIPAEYLTLVPSKPDEYEKLGSYAMAGLPAHYGRFMEEGKTKSKYSVIVAGYNFGCGSSREHAPVALGAAGIRAVVAESYARIFFRNSVATGELYPVESETKISAEFHTGDDVLVDLEANRVVNHTTGKQYTLKPIGDAGPVIDAGGVFAYARQTGMISSPT